MPKHRDRLAQRPRALWLPRIARGSALLLAGIFGCRAAPLPAAAPDGDVRAPAVAGQFYSGNADTLRAAVEALLADAVSARAGRPIALVAPHAGYVFSGPIAADAFRQASGQRYDTIVVLGPNHTVPGFRGAAIAPQSAFRTPLGLVGVDQDAVAAVKKECADCRLDAAPHAREHSIEAQLPFVQQLFPGAEIVPIVVGDAELALCQRIGAALARALAGRSVLVVASSDLSHYPAAKDAEAVDNQTLRSIATLDPAAIHARFAAALGEGRPALETAACGAGPILVATVAAKALGATRGVVVSYAHSGQTLFGDEARVVGYGAVALTADERPSPPPVSVAATAAGSAHDPLTADDRRALLKLARETIRRMLVTESVPLPRDLPARLLSTPGVFVTLKKHGQLRGCIGRVVGGMPLAQLVGAMAIEAAFKDPRFPPLAAPELSAVEIEISLLTPPRRVPAADAFVVGRDGVMLQKDGHAAVFLPQVAPEQGWDRDQTLDQLCEKAGLRAGCWRRGATFMTFQGEAFHE